MTSITSTALPPNPPCSSANGTPSNPISANAPHTFSLHPLSESTILARASSAYSFARYRLRLSASSCCSSLRSKFIPMLLARAEFRHRARPPPRRTSPPPLQPARRLRDDVALDLVGPRVDRRLAQVAVARGEAGREVVEVHR